MINRWILLGVLAFLVIAGVAVFVVFAPAPSDERGTDGILVPRGPVGVLDRPPEEILWNPVRGARSYGVEIMDARQQLLWKGPADRESILFPAELEERVRGGETFFYRITARGALGKKLVSSEAVLFRCRPPADSTGD
ncbi:MAG: hypothetical protein JW958_02770 [Candidatus Eisenbacteria bacterium]|nr:hypothetical protein [Candidatus Eisenbacteria bacterium]